MDLHEKKSLSNTDKSGKKVKNKERWNILKNVNKSTII